MIIVLQNRFFVYFCHPEREKRSLQIQAKIAQLVEHDLAKVGVAGSSPVFRSKNICPGGGIGRHARLKILCPSGRAGSSPAPGTKRLQLS